MAKEPRANRVPVMMSDEELRAIDDWRFEARIATRSDAIRRLAQMAINLDRLRVPLVKAMSNEGRVQNLFAEALDKVAAKGPVDKGLLKVLEAFFHANAFTTAVIGSIILPTMSLRANPDDIEKALDEAKAAAAEAETDADEIADVLDRLRESFGRL